MLVRKFCVIFQESLSSKLHSKACLESCQTFVMEFFIVNGFYLLLPTFAKKLHRRCLAGSSIRHYLCRVVSAIREREECRRHHLNKHTAQKTKFSIKDFFSKCDQICNFCVFCSHLLKKSLMANFIFLCSDSSHPLH